MALDPSNSSNLEQLALKKLTCMDRQRYRFAFLVRCGTVNYTVFKKTGSLKQIGITSSKYARYERFFTECIDIQLWIDCV